MDLGPNPPPGMLSSMSEYNFENFEDDVSKESGDLTVDAGYVIYVFGVQIHGAHVLFTWAKIANGL